MSKRGDRRVKRANRQHEKWANRTSNRNRFGNCFFRLLAIGAVVASLVWMAL
jgi:hypothetical protein